LCCEGPLQEPYTDKTAEGSGTLQKIQKNPEKEKLQESCAILIHIIADFGKSARKYCVSD
jgi:hypothetical protein